MSHHPIDDKDSNPEYANEVFSIIKNRFGDDLKLIPGSQKISGTWEHSWYGTIMLNRGKISKLEKPWESSDPNSYKVMRNGQVSLFEKVGKAGIANNETYYAAINPNEEMIVLWNGDGSAVSTMKKTSTPSTVTMLKNSKKPKITKDYIGNIYLDDRKIFITRMSDGLIMAFDSNDYLVAEVAPNPPFSIDKVQWDDGIVVEIIPYLQKMVEWVKQGD